MLDKPFRIFSNYSSHLMIISFCHLCHWFVSCVNMCFIIAVVSSFLLDYTTKNIILIFSYIAHINFHEK